MRDSPPTTLSFCAVSFARSTGSTWNFFHVNQQSRLDQDHNMNHRDLNPDLNHHTFHLDHDHHNLPITITKFIILPKIIPIIIGKNAHDWDNYENCLDRCSELGEPPNNWKRPPTTYNGWKDTEFIVNHLKGTITVGK